MPGGRPTLYDYDPKTRTYVPGSTVAKVYEYLDNYQDYGDVLPTEISVSEHLGVGLATIKRWKNDPSKEDFLFAMDRLSTKQARILLNDGLAGKMPAWLVKLMLANHGYTSKGNYYVNIGLCDLSSLSEEELEAELAS